MATGPMQFGADNNAGPDRTVLQAQGAGVATLVVMNEGATSLTGILVQGGGNGPGVIAVGGPSGAVGMGDTGVVGVSNAGGNGVFGRSSQRNGVQGNSDSQVASGVYGENMSGGLGVAGRSNSTGVAGFGIGAANGVFGTSEARNGVQGNSDSQVASGVYGENMSGGGFGVAGRSNAPGIGPGGAAVFGDNARGWAGLFNGSVLVRGSLSVLGDFFHSGSGFRIDHPIDPDNSYLNHSFVESSDMMNVYNGNVATDSDGNATVELPPYFEALNRDFRYQLTVIGQFATAIVADEVRANRFTIKTDKPNVVVSWQVTGIRQDAWANAHRTEAEMSKPEGERGKYLTPREHDKPAAASVFRVESPPSMIAANVPEAET